MIDIEPEGWTLIEWAEGDYANEWWWLSFADGDLPKGSQFLGVAIVRGWGILAATIRAHALGINPGGEVAGVQIPLERLPDPSFRERLLTREEAEALP